MDVLRDDRCRLATPAGCSRMARRSSATTYLVLPFPSFRVWSFHANNRPSPSLTAGTRAKRGHDLREIRTGARGPVAPATCGFRPSTVPSPERNGSTNPALASDDGSLTAVGIRDPAHLCVVAYLTAPDLGGSSGLQ